jgi:hypothetical protein
MFSIDAGLMISMILAVAAAEPHLREVATDGSVSAMTLAGLVVGDWGSLATARMKGKGGRATGAR